MTPFPARFARLVPAALLALSLAATSASAQVVKVAMLPPEGSNWHAALKEMGEKWKTASGGKVQLRVYAGGVAGDDVDVVRKMKLGTLGGAVLTGVGVAQIDKSIYALEVPMMYASVEEIDQVLARMRPKIDAALEAKGFVVLDWVDAGWVRFFTKTAARTPQELQKQKLFAWAGDNDALEVWKAAGFNVVPLPSTEISTALQTGLVTAISSNAQAALLLQWFNHAKFMTEVNWARLLGAIVVSKAQWEKIPADVRPALLAAAREAGARLRTEARAGEVKDVAAMKARGLTVVPVDPKTEAAWRAVVEAVHGKIRGAVVPPEFFDEAKRHLADIRAKKPAGK